jgi:hypothetical protein
MWRTLQLGLPARGDRGRSTKKLSGKSDDHQHLLCGFPYGLRMHLYVSRPESRPTQASLRCLQQS